MKLFFYPLSPIHYPLSTSTQSSPEHKTSSVVGHPTIHARSVSSSHACMYVKHIIIHAIPYTWDGHIMMHYCSLLRMKTVVMMYGFSIQAPSRHLVRESAWRWRAQLHYVWQAHLCPEPVCLQGFDHSNTFRAYITREMRVVRVSWSTIYYFLDLSWQQTVSCLLGWNVTQQWLHLLIYVCSMSEAFACMHACMHDACENTKMDVAFIKIC